VADDRGRRADRGHRSLAAVPTWHRRESPPDQVRRYPGRLASAARSAAGTEGWYDELYEVKATPTLFGTEEEHVVKAKTETIGRYFNERLKEIFAGVADPPGVLRNSANNPLYLLCFAAANERGAPTALRIAEHLLKEVR